MSGFVLVSAIRFPKFDTGVAKADAGIEKYNVVKVWVGLVENLYPTAFEKVENFMPHGAPAVQKDKDGNRHFVVWNTYQLHGDVGERIKLTRKVSTVT